MAAKWGKKGKQADKRPVEVGASPERISNRLDHLLVAESKPTPGRLMKFTRNNWKQLLVLFVLVITVIGSGSAWWLRQPRYAESDQCRRETSSPIYKQAARYMNPGAVSRLSLVVNKIESMKDYDIDVNCMYALVVYYLNSGDSIKARASYDIYAKLYSSDTGLSSDYEGVVILNPELEARIQYAEELRKQSLKNMGIENVEEIEREFLSR